MSSSSAPATSATFGTGHPATKKPSIPAVTASDFHISGRSTRTLGFSISTRSSTRNSFQYAATIAATVSASPIAATGANAAANAP